MDSEDAMMMVWPSAFTEIKGPYVLDCLGQ